MDQLIQRLLALALAGALLSPLPAQTPDARQILNHSAAVYAGLESFHFERREETILRSPTFDRKRTSRLVSASDGEGRVRVESDDGALGGIAVFDGKAHVVYLAQLNEYTIVPAEVAGNDDGSPGAKLLALSNQVTQRYKAVNFSLESAEWVAEEKLPANGSELACHVIDAQYKPPPGSQGGRVERRLWIDKHTGLVLREDSLATMRPPNLGYDVEVNQRIEFDVAVSGQLPNELFLFHEPEGALLVESFTAAPAKRDERIGRHLPYFELTSLDDQVVTSTDFEGQPVLLNFWATWCAPCRVEMPRIEALYKKYAAAGFRLYGINDEARETADDYIDRNGYTFPTLSDPSGQVAKMLGVDAIPTMILLDAEGRVQEWLVGSNQVRALETALERMGMVADD